MERLQSEMKKVISKVKEAQKQFQELVDKKNWVEEARKYAQKRSVEVKKLITTDVKKVRVFLEKEKKELEKIQKKVPGEIKKVKEFVESQRKEFEKLIRDLSHVASTNVSSNIERNFKKKKSPSRAKKSADDVVAETLSKTPGNTISSENSGTGPDSQS